MYMHSQHTYLIHKGITKLKTATCILAFLKQTTLPTQEVEFYHTELKFKAATVFKYLARRLYTHHHPYCRVAVLGINLRQTFKVNQAIPTQGQTQLITVNFLMIGMNTDNSTGLQGGVWMKQGWKVAR